MQEMFDKLMEQPGWVVVIGLALGAACYIARLHYKSKGDRGSVGEAVREVHGDKDPAEFVRETTSLMVDHGNTKRRVNRQGANVDWHHDRLAQIEFELKLKPPAMRRQIEEKEEEDE